MALDITNISSEPKTANFYGEEIKNDPHFLKVHIQNVN